ncbi:MAG: hypothetical protein AB1798_14585 [Spirochaetota bacterium]
MKTYDPIKVYDARWETDEFSENEIQRLFEASLIYGRELGVDTITITRDGRLGCARVMEIGLETARKAGFRVYCCTDPISTPQSYFTALWVTREHPQTFGFTITASHNPAKYVGLKFTVPVVQAIGLDCGPLGGLRRIREIYHSREKLPAAGNSSLNLVNLTDEYIRFSMHAAGIGKGSLNHIKLVLDSFNGSAGSELYRTLMAAGVEVYPLKLVPDGYFPAGSPNPTSIGKMNDALRYAAELEGALVIGVDGDGDRIVFVDGKGILNAGFAAIPVIKSFVSCSSSEPCTALYGSAFGTSCSSAASANRVLYDPKVNPLALAEWGKLNLHPVLFRNGHSQIKDYMQQINACMAAEESGHYYHRMSLDGLTINAENSLLTILLFLKVVTVAPGFMDNLFEMQSRVFSTGEINYQFENDDIRDRALNAILKSYKDDNVSIITATEDGIDLQGTQFSKGVSIKPGNVTVAKGWYSGYIRPATNEKGVVRLFLSTGDSEQRKILEGNARLLMEKTFGGKPID